MPLADYIADNIVGYVGDDLLGGAGILISEVQALGTIIGTPDSGPVGSINLLTMTQALGNSADWQGYIGSASDNMALAPDGTNTLSAFTEAAGTDNHQLSQVVTKAAAAIQYTASFYAKPGLRSRIVLQVYDGTNGAYMVADLSGVLVGVAAGTFGVGWSAQGATVSPAANGLVRCTLTFTTNTATAILFAIQSDAGSGTQPLNNNFAGNASGPAYFGGWAQLEAASAASAYVAVTSNGNTLAKLTDGDLTTFWNAPASNAWAGLDLGAGTNATFTRYRFAPRPSGISPSVTAPLDFESLIAGTAAQVSSDPAFGSGVSTLDTIPSAPFYPRFQLSERPVSGSGRAFRVQNPSGTYGGFAELQVFAKYGTVPLAAPVTPTISPWGGRFPAGSTEVTLSSKTQSAKIYYTTDGSTPSNTHGTLYAGPFTLNMGGISTTLKAVSYDPALSTTTSAVVSGIFNGWGFKPRDDLYDNYGNLIQANAGGIIWANNKYYWCGAFINLPNQLGTVQPSEGKGVWLYSSPDLYNWTIVGQILAQPPGWKYTERPHIIYNALNNNYVMWAHLVTKHGSIDNAGVATAPSIEGPWTWVKTGYDPDGTGFWDNSLFVDDDGVTAYIMHVPGGAVYAGHGIQISRLSADYQSTTTDTVILPVANNTIFREAPVMIKHSGNYFLINSQGNSYDCTQATDICYLVSTASNPLSGWGALPGPSIFATPTLGTNYNGQSAFIIVPQGKTQSALLGTDYWTQPQLYGSRQVWFPISFPTPTTLRATTPAQWALADIS